MDNRVLQIQNRTCRVYGTVGAEYLLLQMADEHDPAGMEREAEALRRQTARPFLLVAVPVENWNDDLSPWSAPPAWGKQGFGGRAEDTLAWLEQAVPSHPSAVFYKGRCQGYFGRLLAGGAVCAVGGNPDRYPVRRGGGFAVRVVSRLARIRSGAPYPNAARLPQPW